MRVYERLLNLLTNTRGVTLVEYGIAIALAVLVGSATLALLAGEIGTALGVAGTAMPN